MIGNWMNKMIELHTFDKKEKITVFIENIESFSEYYTGSTIMISGIIICVSESPEKIQNMILVGKL